MDAIMQGVDCGSKITAAAASQIKAAGYDFVCRYLVPASFWTHMAADEAKAICDAGLKILCVYESSPNRVKVGASAGAQDGQTTYALAKTLNMPAAGIIYFAVDFDAGVSDFDNIEAYLRAARLQTEEYEVGVYGSYSVIEEMAHRGACKGFWQCYAWSHGKTSDSRNVYQYKNGQTVAGISVDFDEAYAANGLWTYNESEDETEMSKNDLTNLAGTGDTPSAECKAATEQMKSLGIFTGDGQGNFGWQQIPTREELAAAFAKFYSIIKS